MSRVSRSFIALAISWVIMCAANQAQATLIQAAWFFDENTNGDDVSSIPQKQTVTAANGNITFDFDLSISVNGGTAFDTTAGDGIAGTFDGNLVLNDVVTYTIAISNIVQNGPHRISLQDLSFRFLGTEMANGPTSSGRVDTGGAGFADWTDANGAGSDFSGHLPGVTTYGTGLAEGFFIERGTPGQQTGAFDVQAGFDIPRTAVWNGAPFGTPITTFSHTVTAGTYRLNDIVVQVHATPEPSSLAFGFVAAMLGMVRVGRRGIANFLGLGNSETVPVA